MPADAGMDLYAAPQHRTPVGRGRQLNLCLMGDSGPTVVFSAGLAGGTIDWGRVQPFVARRARTVSYDHAGFGFSDPGPLPRNVPALNADLRAALKSAGLTPPYLLVGHSWGGVLMRDYAARHSDEVCGLLLVDSITDDFARRLGSGFTRGLSQDLAVWRRLGRLAESGMLTADSEAYRQHVRLPRPDLTPAVNQAFHKMWTRPGYLRSLASQTATLLARSRRPPPLPSLGDLPLTVLSAAHIGRSPFIDGNAQDVAAWFAMHDDLAAISQRGQQVTVESGHNIPIDNPRAVVAAVDSLLEVISEASPARALLAREKGS